MTIKEIIENNKLIAEFMGYASRRPITDSLAQNIGYNTSYDVLIPVVEKIEGFVFDGDVYYEVRLGGGVYVYIMSNDGDDLITIDDAPSKLEALYRAVVEFIKWYNELNS